MSYLVLHFMINPASDTARDILIAMLADSDFDSFEYTESGIDAYINKDNFQEDNVNSIIKDFFIQNVSIDYKIDIFDDKNWNEEWEKNGFEPIIVDDLCVIHDSNHLNVPQLKYDIIINPKMSFGTGTHETTRMLIKEILQSDYNGQTVLDMGCGTCILGIGMSIRGAKSIVAIDIDDACIKNSIENCQINGIKNVKILHGDSSLLSGMSFDTVIANIHKNILIKDLPNYVSVMNPGAILYMSGFFTDDSEDIIKEAQKYKLVHSKTLEMNKWCVLQFVK